MSIDLKLALNALSDIVANRPLPLREFDQIYMKMGDMIVHAEWMARQFEDKSLVFVGDGDAVGLALAHLLGTGVLKYGPSKITVLDFDERMVQSINLFAAKAQAADKAYGDRIEARLYNVLDPLPDDLLGAYDGFHINPPWGQYNDGESVVVFLERAVQCTRVGGAGVVVIADDPGRPWTNQVLRRTQGAALEHGLVVQQMIPQLHSYHLDDAPDLKSCSLVFRKVQADAIPNARVTGERLEHFYGRNRTLRVQYVRERPDPVPGTAAPGLYEFELLAPPAADETAADGATSAATATDAGPPRTDGAAAPPH